MSRTLCKFFGLFVVNFCSDAINRNHGSNIRLFLLDVDLLSSAPIRGSLHLPKVTSCLQDFQKVSEIAALSVELSFHATTSAKYPPNKALAWCRCIVHACGFLQLLWHAVRARDENPAELEEGDEKVTENLAGCAIGELELVEEKDGRLINQFFGEP